MDPKLIRHMAGVEHYRQSLHLLQGIWDNLSLLGHLSGTGADMTTTRHAFQSLTTDLLSNLGTETLKKTVLEMKATAQVAVDIMVRNLYERTADIGFLSSDQEIRRFLVDFPALYKEANGYGDGAETSRAELDARCAALRGRFREYVAKYSVYRDIILLDAEGRVVLQLDESHPLERSQDAVIDAALNTTAAYVERFARSDLVPGDKESLIYAYRVEQGDRKLGVLCLCFRFDDETEGIFGNLTETDDWSVLLLLDKNGKVIASNDGFHIPVGATMELALEEGGRILRFAGREYLAVTRKTQGYQGYMGPGWYGHAMVPLEHAFEKDASSLLQRVPAEVLVDVRSNPSIFPEGLRSIPLQADKIQRELNRSVWNGNVRLGGRQAENASFSKVLLWEVSSTGMKTKEVFERSIANLHETVVSAILHDSRFLASLAVDIMDRNLYERANDCRWWALDTRLAAFLAGQEGDAASVTEILRHINGLYTVYDNIVLFDTAGRVVAVSNPKHDALIGSVLGDDWVRRTLGLPDSGSYQVSPFARSALYDQAYTYIYGAALRAPDSQRVVGGIGIVFDATPQFSAMLRDALPRNEQGEVPPGCLGVFCDRQQQVIAATDKYRPGDQLALDAAFFAPAGEGMANIVALDGQYYAVGARASRGYREYPGVGAIALIFIPLGEVGKAAGLPVGNVRHAQQRARASGDAVDVATFTVGGHWFGLRSEHIAEAIDLQGTINIPGAPDCCVGYVMWQGKPIVVVNLGKLLSPETPCTGSDVVVVDDGSDNGVFGVLVDQLNDIPEVPRERIETVGTAFTGEQVLIEAIVRPEKSNEPILPILAADRIRARVASRAGSLDVPLKGELQAADPAAGAKATPPALAGVIKFPPEQSAY